MTNPEMGGYVPPEKKPKSPEVDSSGLDLLDSIVEDLKIDKGLSEFTKALVLEAELTQKVLDFKEAIKKLQKVDENYVINVLSTIKDHQRVIKSIRESLEIFENLKDPKRITVFKNLSSETDTLIKLMDSVKKYADSK